METVNCPTILIVEPDRRLREEVFNFLLSAGYEKTEETDSLSSALDKVRQSAYDVIVADAGSLAMKGMELAQELAQFRPGMKVILMINAEDQQTWSHITAQVGEVHFLLKTTFAQNLLYLLEEPPQP